MNIVITHTDFRLYWPARISALNDLLCAHGHTLHTIEIAGKGSPYAFSETKQPSHSSNWTCLFPERTMESISGREASRALSNKLDEINPDVVLAGAIAFPSGATAVNWCKSKKNPVVIFDNARLKDVPRSWFVNFIKRCIYRNVDAVISPAPSQAEAFEYWGVDTKRLFFGLNVVDNDWFSSRVNQYKKVKNQIRKELEVPEQFILGVGRFIKKKNWLTLLAAFSELKQDTHKNKWAIVLVCDGPEKNIITHYCKKHPNINIIIKPFASQEDLCKYYTLAAAVILPSSYGETWGLVINEAMAASLPVLVSDQCGCAQSLVINKTNGYLFSANESGDITRALQLFINNSTTAKTLMGKRSSEIISHWSLDRFSQAAWQAIEHSLQFPIKNNQLIDSLIIKCWKGRYRPI